MFYYMIFKTEVHRSLAIVFFMVEQNISGSSVQNLLHLNHLTPKTLRWPL